jgi:hypothetical protein
MNWDALWGILAAGYGVFVVFVAKTKLPAIWNMGKVKGFKKVLGEKGTVIFFYIWGAIFIAVAIWLFVWTPIG